MKTILIFGYLITFLYCSKPEEKLPEASRYTLRQATKNQDNLRRVPARSLSLAQHEKNMVGLRNILSRVRAERENKKKNSETQVKNSESAGVEESKSPAH